MTCHSGDFALQATLRVAIKPNLQGLWMLYGDRLEKQNVKVHLTNVVKKKLEHTYNDIAVELEPNTPEVNIPVPSEVNVLNENHEANEVNGVVENAVPGAGDAEPNRVIESDEIKGDIKRRLSESTKHNNDVNGKRLKIGSGFQSIIEPSKSSVDKPPRSQKGFNNQQIVNSTAVSVTPRRSERIININQKRK